MMSVFKLISFLFVVIAAGEESELLVGLKNDGNEIKGFGAVISSLSTPCFPFYVLWSGIYDRFLCISLWLFWFVTLSPVFLMFNFLHSESQNIFLFCVGASIYLSILLL